MGQLYQDDGESQSGGKSYFYQTTGVLAPVPGVDRTLAVFCAKLSEFFAQFRTVGVNYDLVVKELKSGFSENKAMTMLYELEKATLEMTSVMHEVKDLAKRFEAQWLQQLNQP